MKKYWITEEQLGQLVMAFLNPAIRPDEKRIDWKAREKLVRQLWDRQILDEDSESNELLDQ